MGNLVQPECYDFPCIHAMLCPNYEHLEELITDDIIRLELETTEYLSAGGLDILLKIQRFDF